MRSMRAVVRAASSGKRARAMMSPVVSQAESTNEMKLLVRSSEVVS